MDCEKFDEDVMDALYGELDEISMASLRRHVEGCPRCGGIFAALKATREATTLSLEQPSAELEDRILAAEREVQKHAPWHRKLLRGAAWAGSHAMRPQLAMAALLMFVIGSSLLLLRVRPGSVSPVSVSEKGAPADAPAAQSTATLDSKGGDSSKISRGYADSEDQPRAGAAAPAAALEAPGEGKAEATATPADEFAFGLDGEPDAKECARLLSERSGSQDKGIDDTLKSKIDVCRGLMQPSAAPAVPGATASTSASPSSGAVAPTPVKPRP